MGPLIQHPAEANRPRRVAELLAILWILAIADLLFTLWAHFFTPFYEMNPLAHYMLRNNLIPSLILFKLVVTAIGSQIFWRLRRFARAEAALWLMTGVYVALAMQWSNYTRGAMTLALGGRA